jgi:hypothetical protein
MHVPTDLKTSDLFLSAYLLTLHIPLLDVSIERREKPKVVFAFVRNQESLCLIEQFQRGQAAANVLELKKNYQHVQDMLHDRRWGLDAVKKPMKPKAHPTLPGVVTMKPTDEH